MKISKAVPRACLAGGIVATWMALAPVAALAQSWLPDQGHSSVSIVYSGTLNQKHYTSTGDEVDAGHTTSHIWTIAGSYSPTDRLMLQASIPFVNARYKGGSPHPEDIAGDIDDGTWHGTLTDALLTAHYQVSEGPIAFAPYVGLVIPTHDYATLGHSAPGRGLNEYWLGFYTAASLNQWIPRTYVEMRGNYAWVDEVQDIAHDRINTTLELGYYFNETVSARLFWARQWTQGGIDLPVLRPDPLYPYHDQLADDEFINVGGGFSWSINERIGVFGLYTESIAGWNSHKVDQRVTMGMSYGIGRARY